jgi:hypothetical protein
MIGVHILYIQQPAQGIFSGPVALNGGRSVVEVKGTSRPHSHGNASLRSTLPLLLALARGVRVHPTWTWTCRRPRPPRPTCKNLLENIAHTSLYSGGWHTIT